jgi:hypothetical protein
MKQLIEKIRVMIGISQEDADDWIELSEYVIEEGEIQRLTPVGLLQAIDATDTHLYLSIDESISFESEYENWDIGYNNIEDAMDEIHDTIALSSGIHPDILFEIFSLRADYYTDLYVQMACDYD